jgi:hypothetical protein
MSDLYVTIFVKELISCKVRGSLIVVNNKQYETRVSRKPRRRSNITRWKLILSNLEVKIKLVQKPYVSNNYK